MQHYLQILLAVCKFNRCLEAVDVVVVVMQILLQISQNGAILSVYGAIDYQVLDWYRKSRVGQTWVSYFLAVVCQCCAQFNLDFEGGIPPW